MGCFPGSPKLCYLCCCLKLQARLHQQNVCSKAFQCAQFFSLSSSGTNNARLAAMLRQLAQYHAKDPNNLFMVRLAQVGGKIRKMYTKARLRD